MSGLRHSVQYIAEDSEKEQTRVSVRGKKTVLWNRKYFFRFREANKLQVRLGPDPTWTFLWP